MSICWVPIILFAPIVLIAVSAMIFSDPCDIP